MTLDKIHQLNNNTISLILNILHNSKLKLLINRK